MFEIAHNLEQIAVRFSPVVLIGPGLTAVLVGLFIWLGGLGFRKPLVAVAGAVGGAVCGFFIAGRSTVLALVSAITAGVLATVFERIFIAIIAAALAALLGIVVLAVSFIESADGLQRHPEYEISNQAEQLNIRQSIEIMKAYIVDFTDEIKQTCLRMPAYNRAAVAVLVVIVIVAGFFFWRLASALCCAAFGTLFIFAGMSLLLFYKGAAPVSDICQKRPFYLVVSIAMVAFGTVEQLLLCRYAKDRRMRKRQVTEDSEQSEETKTNWRTR